MRKPLAPCGTNAAYMRHVVAGEETDQPCKDAHAAYAASHKTADAAGRIRKAAMEKLAEEYPERFRDICAALVNGENP